MIKVRVKEIFDHVAKLPTYKAIDFSKGAKFIVRSYCKREFGCSAFSKKLEEGFVVARNMDWKISNKPIFIFKIAMSEFYKSIGICYDTFISPDWKTVKKQGIEKKYYNIIPFITCDYMNEKGLYIELNMRPNEKDEAGHDKWKSVGSNPKKEHISTLDIIVRISLNCSTVNEVLKFIKNFDIYSLKTKTQDYPVGIMVSDSKGDCGVIEVLNNEIFFTKTNFNGNFFCSTKHRKQQNFLDGISRINFLKNSYESINTSEEMYELIKLLTFSAMYNPENCRYIIKDELTARKSWQLQCQHSINYWNDPKTDKEFNELFKRVIEEYRKMTREQKQNADRFWESAFTVLANCTEKTMKIRFFEDDSKILNIEDIAKF